MAYARPAALEHRSRAGRRRRGREDARGGLPEREELGLVLEIDAHRELEATDLAARQVRGQKLALGAA